MTAVEVIQAARATGIALCATNRGTLRYRPTPPPALLDEMRSNRDGVLELLRDPDHCGWEMPSPEAMEAALKARRVALYVAPLVNLSRPGLGQQFRDEMRRLAGLGLVRLRHDDAPPKPTRWRRR